MKRIIMAAVACLVFSSSSFCKAASVLSKPAHVFIVAGQSNTDGRVSNKLLPAYIKALSTDTAKYEQGAYKHCQIVQNRADGVFKPYWPEGRITKGVWTYDAVAYYKIEQALQEDFYVVKYAVGGTSIQYPNDTAQGRYWSANPEWLKNTSSYENKGHSLLLSFTETMDAAIDQTLSKIKRGYKIDAFLWHQGESDDVYATKYYENLKAVVAYVRTHLTEKTGVDYSHLPFVFGTVSRLNRHFRPEVEAAMKRIAGEDPDAYLIDMSKGELQKDKTHFTEKSAEYMGLEMYKILEKILDLSNTKFKIAAYRDNKDCALSYTFDDGLLEHATLVAPQLNKLGIKGTFWVNGNAIDKNDSTRPRMSWEQLKTMAKEGHEISNHGWSHKNLPRLTIPEINREIMMNDSAICQHIGQVPLTFCYPYNAKNDTVVAIASENRIDTRTKQFSVGGKSTDEILEKRISDLIASKDWGVTMTHGITYGYDHFTSADILWNHLQKVKQLENKIWVGTFREVAAYLKERDALSYEIVKSKTGFTLIPTIRLDKKLFREKLTAMIDLSAGKKLKIKQDGKFLKVHTTSESFLFEFDPFAGPLIVQISKK